MQWSDELLSGVEGTEAAEVTRTAKQDIISRVARDADAARMVIKYRRDHGMYIPDQLFEKAGMKPGLLDRIRNKRIVKRVRAEG